MNWDEAVKIEGIMDAIDNIDTGFRVTSRMCAEHIV
jgi:hypothetical protein